MNKKEMKKRLESLILQREQIEHEMKGIVAEYMYKKTKKKIRDIDDVPYKRIIRTDFNLVI